MTALVRGRGSHYSDKTGRMGEGIAFPACITRIYIAAIPALLHMIMHAQWKTELRENNKNMLLGNKVVSSSKTAYDQLV